MATVTAADIGVAVVVCTRDRPHLLAGLLPALVDARDSGVDVVVVDSASDGPETRAITEKAALRLVRCDEAGASRARNAGFAATSAPVVVFTDDDCRPHPRWYAPLADALADSTVGFATGRVLPGTGDGRAMSPLTDETPMEWSAGDDVNAMGHGANMAVRRGALESIGGFDEMLGAGAPLRGAEEKDVFWRLLRDGWHGRFVPESVVEHAAWRSRREALRTGFGYGVGIGGRTAKMARLDGQRPARRVVRESATTLRQVPRAVRAGYRFDSVDLVLRAAGILVGGFRSARYALAEDRFVVRT